MAAHPQFLIIGAPRSGTTSLHDMLSRHPQIFMSSVKEPHFFSSYEFPFPDNDILRVTKSPEAYRELFADAGTLVGGESSTYYFADPSAPERIKAFNPSMKLIAVVREPAERAYSHYLLYGRRGPQAPFFDQVQRLVEQPEPESIYDIVALGRYGEQLERYYQHFPKEQLLVVRFSDLTKRPEAALKRILDFLEVDNTVADSLLTAKPQNQYQVPRNQLVAQLAGNRLVMHIGLRLVPRSLARVFRNRVLLKKIDHKQPADARAMELLRRHYHDDTRRFAQLVGVPAEADKLW